jgi:HSP20 family molecular chaperone IbpA
MSPPSGLRTLEVWPRGEGLIRIEEFREDGALVIRADLPGIDPDQDVELTVSGGMLHIQAERREEEKAGGKGLPAPGTALRVGVPVAAASGWRA